MAKSQGLREIATDEQKRALRKMKRSSHTDILERVKNIVYAGNRGGVGPAMQFWQDVTIYGLWEALLYVEGYEKAPYRYFECGTAKKAFDLAVATLQQQQQHAPANA